MDVSIKEQISPILAFSFLNPDKPMSWKGGIHLQQIQLIYNVILWDYWTFPTTIKHSQGLLQLD